MGALSSFRKEIQQQLLMQMPIRVQIQLKRRLLRRTRPESGLVKKNENKDFMKNLQEDVSKRTMTSQRASSLTVIEELDRF